MRIRGCKIVDLDITVTEKILNGHVLVDWNPEDKGKCGTSYFEIFYLKVKCPGGIPCINVSRVCKIEKRKEGMECFSSAKEAVNAAKAELKKIYWFPRKLLVDQSVLEYYSTF